MDEQGELAALYVSSISWMTQLTKSGVTSTSEVDTSDLEHRIVLPNALLLSYNLDVYVFLLLEQRAPTLRLPRMPRRATCAGKP
jgi:hypothetical protein